MTDVSIVIASFNTRDLLAGCLASIADSVEAGELEVFVVDNDSRDGTPAMVRERFPDVKLIVNDSNVGFARANNRALAQARGRYVLLLNPDTMLRPHTLRDVRAAMDARPEVGMAGIKLVRQDGRMDLACRRGFPTPLNSAAKLVGLDRVLPKSRVLGGYNLTWRHPDEDYEVDAIVGAFMFIRREALDDVGLLDERFFMFGEDIDWCWRVRRRNWKVLYLGSQQILHVKGASTSQHPEDMNRHFHRAMYIFHKKHLVQRYPFFVNWAVAAGIAARYAAKALVLRLRRPRAARERR